MAKLTEEQVESVLKNVRSYLDITWTDPDKDAQLKNAIFSTVTWLESVYGHDLDFVTDPLKDDASSLSQADFIARDLLLERCRYIDQKGLDDFTDNYTAELLNLYNLGRVKTAEEEESSDDV